MGKAAFLRRNHNEFWRDRGTTVVPSRRTSLIVDPPDGRIPAFTPEWAKKRGRTGEGAASAPRSLRPSLADPLHLARSADGSHAQPQLLPDRASSRICRGSPGDDVRGSGDPIRQRSHAPSGVRGYMGDARGRWEGDTLVIDTTNFIGKNDFLGADENLHLVERLTRADANTLLYRFTVDDPTAFTKPWSGEIPMRKTQEGIFNYECHEGNYTMTDILAGARAQEKRALK